MDFSKSISPADDLIKQVPSMEISLSRMGQDDGQDIQGGVSHSCSSSSTSLPATIAQLNRGRKRLIDDQVKGRRETAGPPNNGNALVQTGEVGASNEKRTREEVKDNNKNFRTKQAREQAAIARQNCNSSAKKGKKASKGSAKSRQHEQILDHRVEKVGRRKFNQYLVKWKDYPIDQASWEFSYNLPNHDVKNFRQRLEKSQDVSPDEGTEEILPSDSMQKSMQDMAAEMFKLKCLVDSIRDSMKEKFSFQLEKMKENQDENTAIVKEAADMISNASCAIMGSIIKGNTTVVLECMKDSTKVIVESIKENSTDVVDSVKEIVAAAKISKRNKVAVENIKDNAPGRASEMTTMPNRLVLDNIEEGSCHTFGGKNHQSEREILQHSVRPLLQAAAVLQQQPEAGNLCKIIDLRPSEDSNVQTEFIIFEKGNPERRSQGDPRVSVALVADSTASVYLQLWDAECDALHLHDIVSLRNGLFYWETNQKGERKAVLKSGKMGRLEKIGHLCNMTSQSVLGW